MMREYIDAVFNGLGDPIFVKDHESRLVQVNEAFCQMFGMEEAEVLGKTLAEHVPEDEREHFLSVDREVLDTGKASEIQETLTVDDMQTRYILTKKYRFVDSSGERYLIGIIHDITDQILIRQEIEHQRQALSSLNDRKKKILSVLSHDMRSPMNTVIGSVEVLRMEEEFKQANQTCQHAIGQIEQAAYEAKDMLEDLLEWAVQSRDEQHLQQKDVRLDELVQGTINSLRAHADRKNVDLVYKMNGVRDVKTDPRAVRVIFRNLIQNAIKFTGSGGMVKVEVKEHADHYEASVKDNGVGMDQATIDKLFKSAINTSTRGTYMERGTGLGLSLCHEFITALGGVLRIESEIGKGSDFIFTIPK